MRTVGRIVEIGAVDLPHYKHVDVMRRRSGLTGVSRSPRPEDQHLLGTRDGELFGNDGALGPKVTSKS